ncbi:membrane-spanning 4-domains subfamily A member 4A [Clupea harengus]|uniref:Membrane-spanning 4-domains subfamily A member 4A n=1 Tax=Clupea harengus TaxID=7950 RepID=A0A6P3VRH0_CLUHA|nr:membrane-spanning 4-domains subfamily A member 4A [Clupea harengus]
MPSTLSTSKGLMVVTKIVPLEDHCDIPITNVVNSESKKPTTQNEKLPEMTRLFQKGYPMPLGIVQIFLGMMTLALGVLVILSSEFFGEVPLGLGIFFMISGSISAAAHEGKRICLIKGTLAMNIISSLVALAGIGYFCMELAKQPEECKREEWDQNYRYWQCMASVNQYKAVVNGVKGLLLVMAVFQFCVSTTISVFSAKAIRQDSADQLGGTVRFDITGTGADESSTVPLLP